MKNNYSDLKENIFSADSRSGKFMKVFMFIVLLYFQTQLYSQIDSTGSLKVALMDEVTKEAIPFANVVILDGKNKSIAVETTNIEGEAFIRKLKPGVYRVKGIYVGYKPKVMEGVKIMVGKTTYIILSLDAGDGIKLNEVEVITYQMPLIDPDVKTGNTITRQDYQNLAVKSINTSNSVNVRGARASSTTHNYQSDSGPNSIAKIGGVMDTERFSELKPGTLTAGEIDDFKKWDLWTEYSKPSLSTYKIDWQISPSERYVLQLMNTQKKALVDAEVIMLDKHDKILWKAKTDNTGKAELWSNFCGENDHANYMVVNYNGRSYKKEKIKSFRAGINTLIVNEPCKQLSNLDILFMVDATGSMSDEINYLKAELTSILENASKDEKNMQVRTGSLFYRCQDNSYVTKASEFSASFQKTTQFISEQSASEGGLEAVELALNEAVNNFNWTKDNATRILFIVMDEPPGKTNDKVRMIQEAMKTAAEKGIRIVPLIASGGTGSDTEQKSMEYLMRCLALATNGTYAFLTDHSGVGLKHDKPVTPQYDVEFMNKLLLRIIRQFSRSSCNEVMDDSLNTKDTLSIQVVEHVVLDSLKRNKTIMYSQASVANDNLVNEINTSLSDSLSKSRSIKYYPNPCHGELTIETYLSTTDLYLSDINGKVLERIVFKSNEKTKLNLQNYPAGVYFIQVKSGDSSYSGRVVLVTN
jgi:hypothetical protein